eukprot:TRINITY_DN2237_c0_g2_i1.p2 TRINITY_DN2237_c0_g2~~TRINITY_DN2237_c0_g2_i1.p2  ORF type:complete len:464 (-),score=68.03 TRINITY_DN2237_c0_g2_i1:32-1423(-)
MVKFVVKAGLLFLSIMPMVAVNFIFDSISAVAPVLGSQGIANTTEIGYLFLAWFSLQPVMSFLTGILIDKVGVNIAMVISLTPMFIGSIIVAWGVNITSFWLIFGGRILCGFGDCVIVTSLSLTGKLFKDVWTETALAFGDVALHIGSVIAFFTLPYIVEPIGLFNCMLIPVGVAGFSIATSILYLILDWKFEVRSILHKAKTDTDPSSEAEPKPKMQLSDIKQLPATYWLISICMVLVVASSLLFNAFGTLFLVDTVAYTEENSALVMGFINMIVMLGPVFSYVVLKTKYHLEIWMASLVVSSISFAFMAWNVGHSVASIVICTVTYAITGPSLLAYLPNVVDPRLIGSGMGFFISIFDVVFIIMPPVMGALKESSGAWFSSIIILSVMNLVGFGCILAIWVRNKLNPNQKSVTFSTNLGALKDSEEQSEDNDGKYNTSDDHSGNVTSEEDVIITEEHSRKQ